MRPLITLLGLFTTFVVCGGTTFTEWYDDEGVRHISNVPRECISAQETILPECRSKMPRTNTVQPPAADDDKPQSGLTRELEARKKSIEQYLRDTDPYNPDSIEHRQARERSERKEREYETNLLKADPAKYQQYRAYQKKLQEARDKKAAEYAKRQALRKELDELNRLEKAP